MAVVVFHMKHIDNFKTKWQVSRQQTPNIKGNKDKANKDFRQNKPSRGKRIRKCLPRLQN